MTGGAAREVRLQSADVSLASLFVLRRREGRGFMEFRGGLGSSSSLWFSERGECGREKGKTTTDHDTLKCEGNKRTQKKHRAARSNPFHRITLAMRMSASIRSSRRSPLLCPRALARSCSVDAATSSVMNRGRRVSWMSAISEREGLQSSLFFLFFLAIFCSSAHVDPMAHVSLVVIF